MKKNFIRLVSVLFLVLSFTNCKTIQTESDSVENVESKQKTSGDFLKKDEINLDWLIGSWENDSSIVYIRSDGTFHHGFKESEGFSGKWSLLDDGTLYISDCQIYDEDPWIQKYKIKVCMKNRLVLIAENGWVCDLHPLKSHQEEK